MSIEVDKLISQILSKKKVKNRKQAIAIALNEAGIKQKRRRK